MQIGAGVRAAGLPIRVVHPVELLDESYRLGGIYDMPAPAGGSDRSTRALAQG
jgi:glycolate oxidase iron-sulfur subunit